MAETIQWSQLAEQAGDVATNFEALPIGNYSLEVVDANYKETSTGKKAWNVQSKVLDEGEHKGRRLFDYVVLTTDNEQALGFFFQKMSVMGLPKSYFAQNPSDDQIAAALIGRRFTANVGQRTYKGDLQNELKRYLKPISAEQPPVGAYQQPPAAAAPPATYAAPPAPAATAPAPPAPAAPAAPPAAPQATVLDTSAVAAAQAPAAPAAPAAGAPVPPPPVAPPPF